MWRNGQFLEKYANVIIFLIYKYFMYLTWLKINEDDVIARKEVEKRTSSEYFYRTVRCLESSN